MNLFSKLKSRKTELPYCSAVVLAAGSSERMGSDKIMLPLGKMPVIARTLKAFEDESSISEIIVVTRQEKIGEIAALCEQYGISKVSKICCGGATRTESTLAGVSEAGRKAKLIAIHDGARPLVTGEMIRRLVEEAAVSNAAIPVLPSLDTLKTVDEKGRVRGTLDRANVVRVQTPQVFDADVIKGALTKAVSDGLIYTDDCAAVERMGIAVQTVSGDPENLKITTPQDMVVASAILRNRGEFA